MLGYCPKICHNGFLPHPSQFTNFLELDKRKDASVTTILKHKYA